MPRKFIKRIGVRNRAFEGDITQIDARDIPEHDLLCAGFPCQSFSISGNRGGFSDARGTMLYEILRIVDHHNPGILKN